MYKMWTLCWYLQIIVLIPLVRSESELFKWEQYISKKPKISKERTDEVNNCIDESLKAVRDALNNTALDPLTLPPYSKAFLSGTGYGNITLKNGSLIGISTIHRLGNVIIMYKYPMLRAHIPLNFKKLSFAYRYYTELAGISATNILNGSISTCHFLFDFIINVRAISISRNQFKIKEIGGITVSMGDKYSGFVTNILLNAIKPVILPVIKLTIEKQVESAIDSTIELLGLTEEKSQHEAKPVEFSLQTKQSLLKIKDIIQCARKGNKNEQENYLNEYTDQLFSTLSEFMLSSQLDPLQIEIPSKGSSTVSISKGKIIGLSSIVRKGRVTFSYRRREFQLVLPIGFKKMGFEFDYEAPLNSGILVGSVQDCIFEANIHISLMYIRFALDKSRIARLGKVKVWLRGSAVGFTTSVILRSLQPFWEPVLYMTLEDQVQKNIVTFIDSVNNTTCKLLGNCDSEIDKIFVLEEK